MMRVLFVLDSLNMGGAERELVTLLKALEGKRLSIDVCVATAGGVYSNELSAGVNLSRVDMIPPMFLKRLAMALSLRVNKLVGKPVHPAQLSWRFLGPNYLTLPSDYDVAVGYSQGFPTYFVATHVKAAKKIAWINTNYKNAGYLAQLDRRHYAAYEHIVCVSDSVLVVFKDSHPVETEKLTVINSFVDAAEVRLLAKGSNPFGDSRIFRIVTVCRLSAPKGLDLLVAAARELKSSGFRFEWHLVGDGDMRVWVKAQVELNQLDDVIVMHGAKSNPFPYMEYADIYCQPSKFEGFSRTVAEARCLGKAIVVTDFASARDQINHGVNGLVAEMSGVSVAAAIRRLANDPDLRERLSENNKRDSPDTMRGVGEVLRLLSIMEN